jgi:hypothetical protein
MMVLAAQGRWRKSNLRCGECRLHALSHSVKLFVEGPGQIHAAEVR